MTEPAPSHPPRVILSATCYADAESAMRLSVLLAREVGASLEGLMVSDEGILRAVQRPRARVVSFSGGSFRQVTDAAMRRAFRSDARLFESALFRLARGSVAQTTFRIASGRLVPVLADLATVGGLVVVGLRRAVRDGGAFVLVTGSGESDDRLLALAGRLAQAMARRLVIYAPADAAPAIRDWLSRNAPAAEFRPRPGAEKLLAEIDRISPAALMIPSGQADLPALPQLLDAARCPVILHPAPPEGPA